MCEFSGKLIAFLDRELTSDEAGCVEWHLQQCSACRGQITLYEEVSASLRAYCDDAVAQTAPRAFPPFSSDSRPRSCCGPGFFDSLPASSRRRTCRDSGDKCAS